MHVKAKRMATAGLLVAFTVIMMILSSTIESSSLFFIVAASFCVGIAIREWGLGFGFAFLTASIMLNLLISPNKMYCITYAGMGIYLWLYELLWKKIADQTCLAHRTLKLWIGKFVIFNLIYIVALFLAATFLYSGEKNWFAAIILLLVGQVVLLIYDMAYRYVQSQIWGRIRGKLMK